MSTPKTPKQMGNSDRGPTELDAAKQNTGRTTKPADAERALAGDGPDAALAGILDRREPLDERSAGDLDSDEGDVSYYGAYANEGGLLPAGEDVGPWTADENDALYAAGVEDEDDEPQHPGGGTQSESEKPHGPDSRWGGGRTE